MDVIPGLVYKAFKYFALITLQANDVNSRIERLKTSKEADNLAANAARLGEPELAAAARARGDELRAAERPLRSKNSRTRAGTGKPVSGKLEGECLFMNGVFESVLQEIELAQKVDADLVCYLQPYSGAVIKKLRDDSPSVAAPWGLFISITSSLEVASYQAEIVEWRDKSLITADDLLVLNQQLATTQPREGAVRLEGEKGKVGINLIGIIRLNRLNQPTPVSEFTKTSDRLPLRARTQAGGYSYVMPPSATADGVNGNSDAPRPRAPSE